MMFSSVDFPRPDGPTMLTNLPSSTLKPMASRTMNWVSAAIEGFAKLGYVEGRNIILEHRFPNEEPERFRTMAAELVALNVDVLMVTATGASYLRDATTKIPIVFVSVPDPVSMKLVQSLARPGGNMTGLSNFGEELAAKRLQLLKELVPGLSRVALLVNRDLLSKGFYIEGSRMAADKLGLAVQVFELTSMEDLEPTFDAMVQAGMQAVTLAQGGFAFSGRATVAKLALARHLALCAYSKLTFDAGALMAYGPNSLSRPDSSFLSISRWLRPLDLMSRCIFSRLLTR